MAAQRPGSRLDERDRDPPTFWSYFLLAVDRAVPGAASAALTELQSGRAELETVLTGLVNELSVLPEDVTLVLDDYHLAEGPEIQPGLTYLLERLPPQVHLVISTRADPALPLSRWRARGELVEVRAPDLRFTAIEAAAYLNDTCRLELGAEDVASLEARTEGWVAALQLTALSLTGREDPSEFIAGFAGDDRYVVDYLADEVLDRQSTDLRRFLLDSSVLDRLTAPLCDAVTGRTDAAATLEKLEQQNLFLVPLDRSRRWYRYHHLFADVLRARLADERPGDVPDLHRRASDWFHSAGEPAAAVRHALSRRRRQPGRRTGRARCPHPAPGASRRGGSPLGRPAAGRCHREPAGPRRRLHRRPDLRATSSTTSTDGCATLNSCSPVRPIEPSWWSLTRPNSPAFPQPCRPTAQHSPWSGGDLTGALEHATTALERAADDDHLSIASASAVSGLASWTDGDLNAAHHGYRASRPQPASGGTHRRRRRVRHDSPTSS